MRAEDEGLVARDGRVRGVPGGAGGEVGFPGNLVGEKASLFSGDDVLDDGHGRDRDLILGIAPSDDDLAWGDFRDVRVPLTGKTPYGCGAEMPMHEEEAVVLALVNETAEACEQADVKTAYGLIMHQGFLIGPVDHADLVVVDGGTEVEIVAAFPDLTGDLLRRGYCGLDKWWWRWRRRQVRFSRGFAALDGERAGVLGGYGNGGVYPDWLDHFARRGHRRSERQHFQ